MCVSVRVIPPDRLAWAGKGDATRTNPGLVAGLVVHKHDAVVSEADGTWSGTPEPRCLLQERPVAPLVERPGRRQGEPQHHHQRPHRGPRYRAQHSSRLSLGATRSRAASREGMIPTTAEAGALLDASSTPRSAVRRRECLRRDPSIRARRRLYRLILREKESKLSALSIASCSRSDSQGPHVEDERP